MCEFISNLNLAGMAGMVLILLAMGIGIGIALANESHADHIRIKNKQVKDLFDEVLEKYYVTPSHSKEFKERLEVILEQAVN